MKANILIPSSKSVAEDSLRSISSEFPPSKRVETKLKASIKGLEIVIKASDVTSLRAAMNTVLKLYKVHSEVKKCLK